MATGALSVAAAGQVLLSGAISSVSSATGSLTVGAASSIALVGSAVSVSSLTGAMTIVRQVALAGTAAGSSVVAGSLSNTAPEVPYLPTTPAPQFATAMGRLWPAYTGPAAQISRTSDNATLDLPTGADLVDMSGYAAFANATTTVAAKLYDQAYVVNGGAANTNDFVQATVAQRPMVRPRNAMRGRQTISLGTDPNGNTVQNRTLKNTVVSNQRQNVTRMWVGALAGGTIDTLGLWSYGLSGGTSDTMSLCYNTQGNNANFFALTNNFGPGTGGPPTAQLAVFTYQSGPSFQKMWINGQLVVNIAAATDAAMTGAAIGSGGWSGAFQSAAEFVADLSWPSILSDADRIAFESKLAAKFGTAYAPFTRCFSMEGDSMTANMNETGFLFGIGRYVQERYNDPLLKTPNFGGGGGTMAQMYASRAATFGAAYNASFSKQAHQIWAGTNDLIALASGSIVGGGAAVWTNSLLPYIQYMTDPARFGSKVIVATMIPRGWLGSSTDRAQREAERLSYNQLIRDNAATYGYTVADYGALSQLVSGPNGGNPNYPNLTYYGTSSDVHLNPAGYQLCVDTVLGPILDTMLA